MGWHEEYPEWSKKVHDLARRLAEVDGVDPDAVVPEYRHLTKLHFTELDARVVEAVDLLAFPEELEERERQGVLARKQKYANRA